MTGWIVPGLAWVFGTAVTVGAPLLSLYATERAKNKARESTEKALADYKAAIDRDLEKLRQQGAAILAATRTAQEVYLQSASLFTTRRHEVYARLYKLLRIAKDANEQLDDDFPLGHDLQKWTAGELEAAMTKAGMLEHERSDVLALWEPSSRPEALRRLDRHLVNVRWRDAVAKRQRAFNAFLVDALYISPEVGRAVITLHASVANYSAVTRSSPDGWDYEKVGRLRPTLDAGLREVYTLMRDELQQGKISLTEIPAAELPAKINKGAPPREP